MAPVYKIFGGVLARLAIDEQFWRDIIKVAAKIGDMDRAIGQAIRFFDLAQQRFKNDRIITENEFIREGFHEALFDVFAERVDGGIMAIGAQKNFGWLKERVQAGRRGGEKSGDLRRRENNNLAPSKPKQTQAKPSKPNPLTLPLTNTKSLNTEIHTSHCPENEQPDLSPDLGAGLHWLGQLWNDFCGPHLSKVKLTTPGSERMKKIVSRVKKHPDRQEWALAIQNLAKSDFHTGQSGKRGERPWKADFDWFLSKEENFARGIEDSFAGKSQKHFTHERENEQTTDEILADVYKAHGMEAPGGTKSR